MRRLKGIFQRAIASFGYEVTRLSGPSSLPPTRVIWDNFVSLTQAYEERLRDTGATIPLSDRRPYLLARLEGTPPAEAYCLVEALVRCQRVEGDVCEFGVAQGETSALIADEIRNQDGRMLHLFDSFEGLPSPTEEDELRDDIWGLGSLDAYAGKMSYPEGMVLRRLADIGFPRERCVVHKGFIERLDQSDATLPRRVSFAYLDFDFYEPTRIVLEFLHAVGSPGTVIVVDDYDFFSGGPKKAVDAFVKSMSSEGTPYECFVPGAPYGHFAVITRTG